MVLMPQELTYDFKMRREGGVTSHLIKFIHFILDLLRLLVVLKHRDDRGQHTIEFMYQQLNINIASRIMDMISSKLAFCLDWPAVQHYNVFCKNTSLQMIALQITLYLL